jgi:hypothetical protein
MMRQLFMLGLVAALAVAQNQNNLALQGGAWRQWHEDWRMAYVTGFTDGYIQAARLTILATASRNAPTVPAPVKKAAQTVLCMKDMSYGQMQTIMDKYVADHPEKWKTGINELFGKAITKACDARDTR